MPENDSELNKTPEISLEKIKRFNAKAAPKIFMLSPEWQRTLRDNSSMIFKFEDDEKTLPKGLGDSLRNALVDTLKNKGPDLDHRFGQGAADWVKENVKTMSPHELYNYYYMLENLPRRPLRSSGTKSGYKGRDVNFDMGGGAVRG